MSKYFFVSMTIIYGEYEDSSISAIEADADLTESQLHDIARFERGSTEEHWDGHFYWFPCYDYAVKLPDVIKPITKAEYDTLGKFIHATHIDNITEQVNES